MSDRGIVITSPMAEIQGGMRVKRPLPDSRTLKKYFTYWDDVILAEVVSGATRPFSTIGNLDEKDDDDIRVAHQEGLLRRQPVDLGRSKFSSDEMPALYQQAQLKAATHFNQNRDGYWSLGQTVERLQLPEEDTVRENVFRTELVEAVPTPAGDVSTRKILKFRDQYSHQLRRFQSKYHNLYATVQSHPNQELALTNAVDELELALDDLQTVMEEQGLRPRRISWDTFWGISEKAALAFLTAQGAGIPTHWSLGVAGGVAAISLEAAEESQPTGWPDEVEDYAYLLHVDRELGE